MLPARQATHPTHSHFLKLDSPPPTRAGPHCVGCEYLPSCTKEAKDSKSLRAIPNVTVKQRLHLESMVRQQRAQGGALAGAAGSGAWLTGAAQLAAAPPLVAPVTELSELGQLTAKVPPSQPVRRALGRALLIQYDEAGAPKTLPLRPAIAPPGLPAANSPKLLALESNAPVFNAMPSLTLPAVEELRVFVCVLQDPTCRAIYAWTLHGESLRLRMRECTQLAHQSPTRL